MITTGEILLVEDNPNDLKLAQHALESSNLAHHIHAVRDGAEAIDYIFGEGSYLNQPTHTRPRVIFLDLKLPLVDGLEVLRRVKTDERTRNIPVVVLTSSREDADLGTAYRLGANSYVVKPVDYDDFDKTLRDLGLYWFFINQPPGE